jgi:hypothetical protein
MVVERTWGFLRLHSLPAPTSGRAQHLTQRAVGPRSTATRCATCRACVRATSRLALLNRPYAWFGVRRSRTDSRCNSTISSPIRPSRRRCVANACGSVSRATFLTEQSRFHYSVDGRPVDTPLGKSFPTAFQLKTFQGVRFALFSLQHGRNTGGVADFDEMDILEPNPRGLMQPIPVGRTITLSAAGRATPFSVDGQDRFTVVDRTLGRVALRSGASYVSGHEPRTARVRYAFAAAHPARARPFSGWKRCTATSSSCRSRRTVTCFWTPTGE